MNPELGPDSGAELSPAPAGAAPLDAAPADAAPAAPAPAGAAPAGEADANRRYLAYGIRALNEGRADIAQLFFEAAGAETIHALNHLATMGAVRSTRENLELAATGEVEEIEVVLPRMIRDAEEEGRADAAESFRLAPD